MLNHQLVGLYQVCVVEVGGYYQAQYSRKDHLDAYSM